MKYLDEYRSTSACEQLLSDIRRLASHPWTLMEVCGGQTHGLLRHGIDAALEGVVELIHGPGCPVCVTPTEDIDLAVEFCQLPDVTVVSFGDMLRVPGSRHSLLQAQAAGGKVRLVYSPLDVLRLAEQQPQQQFVFFAVGFETTAPATALVVRQAARQGITNISLLVSHVRVLPAMELLINRQGQPNHDHYIQGFLAAGHVCTVTGFDCYHEFAARFRTPVVVTGFEPVDLLAGIREGVRQLERGEHTVSNQYGRSVSEAGNIAAIELLESVYEPCARNWRGIGLVPKGGMQLLPEWCGFDARQRFHASSTPAATGNVCRSGEVLAGKIKPPTCEYFATTCTPETPLGAPMVSDEGACAAYYRYARQLVEVHNE